jgi:tyrosine-protein kinase Etk/Wzc
MSIPFQPEQHNPAAGALAVPTIGVDEIEINLIQLVERVLRGYKTILGAAAAGMLLSAGMVMLLPKTYTAEAVFLPPVSTESLQAASLFQRQQNPSDTYLGMLASRSVNDDVIDKLHLKDVYHVSEYGAARATLSKQAQFSVSKNNFISIKVVTGDPRLSVDIANAFLDGLYKLNGSMSASASAHRSEFLHEQLEAERNRLTEAEYEMQSAQEKTGLILPENEAAAGVSATARLDAQLQEVQTRLSALLLSETEQNPQVGQLRRQIETLESQISRQRNGSKGSQATGIPSGARLPSLMLESLRKSRELKERDALYETLLTQYEKARLASVDPGPQLQIVDRAVMPERKSGPPRTSIVVAATALCGLLGLACVLLADPLRQLLRRYLSIAAKLQTR